jgi:large subunit ribosomal protein L37Ae
MAISSGLGSRYGRKIRRKYDTITENYKFKKQICPFCGMQKVSRVAAGVFECSYCKKKFSGGAYEVETRVGKAIRSTIGKSAEAVELMLDNATQEEVVEEKVEEKKEEVKEEKKAKKKKKKEEDSEAE